MDNIEKEKNLRDEFERKSGIKRKIMGEEKTQSGYAVKECYGPDDIRDIKFNEDIGFPGKYPYTRGAYPRM